MLLIYATERVTNKPSFLRVALQQCNIDLIISKEPIYLYSLYVPVFPCLVPTFSVPGFQLLSLPWQQLSSHFLQPEQLLMGLEITLIQNSKTQF